MIMQLGWQVVYWQVIYLQGSQLCYSQPEDGSGCGLKQSVASLAL